MVESEKRTTGERPGSFGITLEMLGLGTALALFVAGILAFYLASISLVLSYIDAPTYQIIFFFLFSALTSNLASRVLVAFIKNFL